MITLTKARQKPRVAFICVHNSCRSQIAEALGKLLAADTFESCSAGTQLKDQINPDAVRVMKRLYGVDMTQNQQPKLLSALPPVDVVITMGCGVQCPYLPGARREDWDLEDPTGQDDAAFERTAKVIEMKICMLRESMR
jgi:arsenate reductase